MEKRSLKAAAGIKPKDDFVQQGRYAEKETSQQRDKSLSSPAVKVSFYWNPDTEQDIEELRLKFLQKHRRKLTRSEVVEQLVKIALRNQKILDMLE